MNKCTCLTVWVYVWVQSRVILLLLLLELDKRVQNIMSVSKRTYKRVCVYEWVWSWGDGLKLKTKAIVHLWLYVRWLLGYLLLAPSLLSPSWSCLYPRCVGTKLCKYEMYRIVVMRTLLLYWYIWQQVLFLWPAYSCAHIETDVVMVS